MTVPPERAEEARALMIDLFPEGFEEREDEDSVELAAYSERGDAARRLEVLGPVSELEVVAGWEKEWRRFHRPVRIGPLWVGPSWEDPDPTATAVVVDPGRAFGTGGHATTRLCLELLLDLEATGIVDIGCGSGVLAVAAARLGFGPVFALDSDEAAVEAARANAEANGVKIEVRLADALTDPLPAVEAAVANIARGPAERVAERFAGGLVIASGYLEEERPAPAGWRIVRRRTAEGWAADRLERRALVG